jgi:thiol-disulfide isomerase/thioredoxin
MRQLINYLFLVLVSVLIGLVIYNVQPVIPLVTPPATPCMVPTCPCHKPQPVITKTLSYYYADWCEPCRAAKPVVDRLEKEGVIVKRVNANKSPELLRENSVISLPTFLCATKEGNIERFIRTENIDEVVKFFK